MTASEFDKSLGNVNENMNSFEGATLKPTMTEET